MTPVSPDNSPPARSRWQFSLRQMFAAITATAILLGWAAWDRWANSHAVACLLIAVLAAIFSKAARRVLIGACLAALVIWLTGTLGHLTEIHLGLYFGIDRARLRALGAGILPILGSAVFLRAICGIRGWTLLCSLLLVEFLVAAMILDLAGHSWRGSMPFDVLKFNCAGQRDQVRVEWTQQVLESHFLMQGWYIAAPWLLGIGVGEVIARRRKPSGGKRQGV